MAGVTMRAMKVEESSPPMITHASGEYIAEFCSASGSKPPTAVALVSRIGRKRTSPARSIASSNGTPSARKRFVKSTSRIEFFVSMPISAMKPMMAVKEIVLPVSVSSEDAAGDTERHDGEHDQRALEVAELQHEDRDDAEQRDDERGLQAAETFGASFQLAARQVVSSRAANSSDRVAAAPPASRDPCCSRFSRPH